MNRKLRSFLRRRGATPDEIARAERAGRLPAACRVQPRRLPGHPTYLVDRGLEVLDPVAATVSAAGAAGAAHGRGRPVTVGAAPAG